MRGSEGKQKPFRASNKYKMEYIQSLIKNEAALYRAKEEWEEDSSNRPHFSLSSSKKDLDFKVLWFETTLGMWLDRHAKVPRVTFFSKKCWNDEVAQARKTWAREKKKDEQHI